MKKHKGFIVVIALAILAYLGYFITHINYNPGPGHELTLEGLQATILEVHDGWVMVETAGQNAERITFNTQHLPELSIQVGDVIVIEFDGIILESDPAQIRASNWHLVEEN
ncbi:MAG: hypothetical protein FWF59_13360 [Turicibacter sp.]|nr:hypothetical protein [Turicibacter sp.]